MKERKDSDSHGALTTPVVVSLSFTKPSRLALEEYNTGQVEPIGKRGQEKCKIQGVAGEMLWHQSFGI